jgi:uncharacterized protein (DUF362 family)
MQAWIDRLDNYDEERLTEVFAARQEFLLGGLAPGDTVLVKPNILQEAEPERALTTNPHFIHAFVRFLLGHGLRVVVGDILQPGPIRVRAYPPRAPPEPPTCHPS